MSTQWVGRTTGLPQEGQSVEFVLDGHDVAMGGTYATGNFRSRWSDYAIERVGSWRAVDLDSCYTVAACDTND